MFLQDTVVEEYDDYYVKREDTACLPPGPPFAKVRGLYRKLQTLKNNDIKVVGYYDTSISMATYGISYFCKVLDMKAVVFRYPYAEGLVHNQPLQDIVWKKYGAEIHLLNKPNMQKIQTNIAKKKFFEIYPDGAFLPPGLKFEETIEEVAKQVMLLPDYVLGGTIVICTGSGQMCAGVIQGLVNRDATQNVIGVLIHKKSTENMRNSIIMRTSWNEITSNVNLKIIDAGYEYTQAEEFEAPFPCCRYYDRKAYKWMIDHLQTLKNPVLFWNIGGDYRVS